MSDSVSDSIVIDADADTIMDVIADFEAYPEWQDEIREVEILETDDDGWGTRVRFVVDAKIFTARIILAYEYTDTSMTWHLVEGDPIRRNDGAYELRERAEGGTEVSYRLEMDPGVPVPGILRRQAAKRIVDAGLKGLKRRVEAAA